jgi:hypothetical protein
MKRHSDHLLLALQIDIGKAIDGRRTYWRGFDAYHNGENFTVMSSDEWQKGWHAASEGEHECVRVMKENP